MWFRLSFFPALLFATSAFAVEPAAPLPEFISPSTGQPIGDFGAAAFLRSLDADIERERADRQFAAAGSAALRGLQGRSLKNAVGRLGLPDRDGSVAGLRVVSWDERMTPPDGGAPLECSIRASLGADDTMRSVQIKGQTGACRVLQRRLVGSLPSSPEKLAEDSR